MKVSDLKPLEKNPFKSKGDAQIKRIAKSIQEFERMMEIRKIVIDEENNILGGNKRYFALKKLGYKEIPDEWIERVTDLTEEQKKEFIVKDNAHWGSEWDYELLSEWNVDLDAWGVGDIQFGDGKEVKEDNYEIPDENEIKTDIVLGDLFEIGEHRLLCGDSTDSDSVAKLMNGEKADMVFTDPPFPNNSEIMHDMIKNIDGAFNNSRLFCDKLMIWFWDNLEFPPFLEQVTSKHIWHKTNGWQAGHFETMYCYHNDEKRHEQKVYSVNNVGGDNNREEQGNHPTPKPIRLIFEIINDLSKNSKLILDLFLGSGSTMLAAHQLKRKCYGVEIDPIYCQIIIDRMRKLDDSLTIKKNGVII